MATSGFMDSFKPSTQDLSFIAHLNGFIQDELILIDSNFSNTKARDRYLVFKQAFSKVGF